MIRWEIKRQAKVQETIISSNPFSINMTWEWGLYLDGKFKVGFNTNEVSVEEVIAGITDYHKMYSEVDIIDTTDIRRLLWTVMIRKLEMIEKMEWYWDGTVGA